MIMTNIFNMKLKQNFTEILYIIINEIIKELRMTVKLVQ